MDEERSTFLIRAKVKPPFNKKSLYKIKGTKMIRNGKTIEYYDNIKKVTEYSYDKILDSFYINKDDNKVPQGNIPTFNNRDNYDEFLEMYLIDEAKKKK
jgi:hypothetical protein